MKTKSLLIILSCLGASTAPGQVASFDFDIHKFLQIDPFLIDTSGHVNLMGVGAAGSIDFDGGETGPWTGTLTIENTSQMASSIMGFYILKPTYPDPRDTSTNPLVNTLTSVTALDSDSNFADHAAEWKLANGYEGGSEKFGNVLNEFFSPSSPDGSGNGQTYQYWYFGAQTKHAKDGLHEDDGAAEFTFALDNLDAVDWADYLGIDEVPHIFVRWQEVAVGGSAKGYTSFTDGGDDDDDGGDDDDVTVPEPSTVAALSILGLGAILMLRRRVIRK